MSPILKLLTYRKSRKEQALLFKVDYQKVFDSVRWDHLDDIMVNLASIVNGKGRFVAAFILQKPQSRLTVRQFPNSYFIEVYDKDTIFPLFLFILVMESFHVVFHRVIDRCMFVHILVGKNDLVYISHQSYADDAMFIGKWSTSNVNVGKMMLHWFFLVPGLKVNVHKSSLHGLWLSVINAIHGSNGSLDQPPPTCTVCSIWITVHIAVTSLKYTGVDLLRMFRLRKSFKIQTLRFLFEDVLEVRKSRKEQVLLFKVDYQNAFDSVRRDHLDDIRRKSRKEQVLLFKVDYQKAFDSVRWDHLDNIMVNLASVVNGNGRFVAAFILQKLQSRLMVRQLPNSYFIEVIDRCMFVHILVGKNDLVYISNQSYADVDMFIGKWSTSNVNVLMMMLH
nr:RNA-directed DNA polymerase, eukaryota, reverse transcriptase zinc-binding domain protein [Tanacetum cinerariifolium]